MTVAGRHEYGEAEAQDFARRLRDDVIPAVAFPAGVSVLAGGGPAQGIDFIDSAYSAFPWLVLAVLILTYITLLRAFRSLLLPLKAVLLNLLAIGATYGLLVIVFKYGVGADLLGLYEFDQVEAWIPIFLFAMLFGLSMDYEVFLVSRMREFWDEGAVERGGGRAGARSARAASSPPPRSSWSPRSRASRPGRSSACRSSGSASRSRSSSTRRSSARCSCPR